METIQWRAEMIAPPKTVRYCKKCGAKTEFISSGLFRINANQKSLDVWLIYRCHKCKTTWNSTIFSRVTPKSIGQELLQKFHSNDADLALRFAMDTEILRQNGAEFEQPQYEVVGTDVDFEQDTKINLVCSSPSKMRLAKLLRHKLGLSIKAFDELVDNGDIRLADGNDIRKLKLQHSHVIIISANKR